MQTSYRPASNCRSSGTFRSFPFILFSGNMLPQAALAGDLIYIASREARIVFVEEVITRQQLQYKRAPTSYDIRKRSETKMVVERPTGINQRPRSCMRVRRDQLYQIQNAGYAKQGLRTKDLSTPRFGCRIASPRTAIVGLLSSFAIVPYPPRDEYSRVDPIDCAQKKKPGGSVFLRVLYV